MAHSLIFGMTESGKTTLARHLSRFFRSSRVGVLVLDPLRDPRWCADFITADEAEFLDVYWRSRSCVAFMDEGGQSVGKYNLSMQETATRGRHWGHSNFYIAQKGTQLAPIVRDMCTNLFLFTSSAKDGALLADEFNEPLLRECSSFQQGEYVHAKRFGESRRTFLEGFTRESHSSDRRVIGRGNRVPAAREEESASHASPTGERHTSQSEPGAAAG